MGWLVEYLSNTAALEQDTKKLHSGTKRVVVVVVVVAAAVGASGWQGKKVEGFKRGDRQPAVDVMRMLRLAGRESYGRRLEIVRGDLS